MTEKWTPGPWFVQPGFHNIYALSNGDGGLTIVIGTLSATQLLGEDREAELEANACLIAAAPDMADYIKRRAEAGDAEAQRLWMRACGEDV